MDSSTIKALARECGFELVGVTGVEPLPEYPFYRHWVEQGMAGEMRYLTDHRADARSGVRSLLPAAKSVVCVGKLYNTPHPDSAQADLNGRGWISRYAWGRDYHRIVADGLNTLVRRVAEAVGEAFESRICVDTAPVLERALARRAGLGWIGRNSCLINEPKGSWFFLGELLLSLELEPDEHPAVDRCGSCTACIDACPTQAIVSTRGQAGEPEYAVDSRLCISYFTIELRGNVPEEVRPGIGNHIFGCDICQDVCPWNQKAPVTNEAGFEPMHFAPRLEDLAVLADNGFRSMFQDSPVLRAKHRGFLRNVVVAMGNDGSPRFHEMLERLGRSDDPVVAGHARWSLARLRTQEEQC